MIIEAYADHKGTTVGVVKMLVLWGWGQGWHWAVLKKEEEIFQNSRKGRTLQAQGRVCAKAQKWELVENIYGISTSALGQDNRDECMSASKLGLHLASYNILLQNQNTS